jgi:outer membrane murein-binding lipoprotein Lpp
MVRLITPWASVRLVSALLVGGLALSGCATTKYVDEQIASVNGRVDAVDAKAQDAIQRADAANAAAQAAAGEAQNANQRLDQLTGRVDRLEQAAAARPTKMPRN